MCKQRKLAYVLVLGTALALNVYPQARPAGAQPAAPGRGSSEVRGTVKDDTGGVIPNATVTLADQAGKTRTAKTDANGSYVFAGVAAGTYTVSVEFTGLQQSGVVAVNVAPGRPATGDVTMDVQTQRQEVTVTESTANTLSTEASANASALVLRQEDLDALPDDPDDLEADLQALAGPAAGPGGNQIFIDGFTGGRMPPKSSIREIRINSNPFSAEYDKLGYGRIEILTKPGSDKFHGQAYFGMSDDVWNSRNPFLTTNPPFRTELFGGNVSGPFGKKASFFIDFDRRNINDNGIINAVIPNASFTAGTPYQSFYSTPQRRTTVSPRVDYQLSPTNTFSARYSYLQNERLVSGIGNFDLPNLSIGSVTLPSTGFSQSSGEHLIQMVDTAVLSTRAVNETRFQYARDRVDYQSQSNTPQINVANSFVAGGSGYTSPTLGSSYNVSNQYEVQNYTTITFGPHTVKAGIRIRDMDMTDYSPRNFNGTFTFLGGSSGASSMSQYLTTVQLLNSGLTSQQVTAMGYGPSQYSVSTGNPKVSFSQWDFGPFVQDDWRVRPNLTLSVGLRWEGQTNISDKTDFAPRIGIAWSPDAKATGGRPKTVIRAGWGVFYDRFPAASVLTALRYNGQNQTNYVVRNPVTYNSSFTVAPPLTELQVGNNSQRYQIDSNLKAPRMMQTVLSVERQLFRRTTVNVSFMNTRGVHILRTDDINAPLPGTYVIDPVTGIGASASGVRPFGNIGDLYDYQSTGIYKQTQIIAGVNTPIGKRITLFSRYSHGNAHSDTDGLQTLPSNPYNFAQDWGRSQLDVHHSIFLGGSITAPWGIRISPFFMAHTGTPFNITTGTDLYGTGQIQSSARPSIVTTAGTGVINTPFGLLNVIPQPGQTVIERNAGVGPGFIELNMRLSKTWGFGTTKFQGASGGATARGAGGGPGGGGPGGGGGGPRGGGGGGGPRGGGPGGPGGFSEGTEHRYNLTLSVMARNALNHENLSTPVGVVTSPFFLQSTGISGGFGPESVASNQRRIDIQLRFTF